MVGIIFLAEMERFACIFSQGKGALRTEARCCYEVVTLVPEG